MQYLHILAKPTELKLIFGYVSSKLNKSFVWNTWPGGHGEPLGWFLKDYGYTYDQIDTKGVNITMIRRFKTFIKSGNDHSKIGISIVEDNTQTNDYWICVGDLNRKEPQRKRGGGFVCFQEHRL